MVALASWSYSLYHTTRWLDDIDQLIPLTPILDCSRPKGKSMHCMRAYRVGCEPVSVAHTLQSSVQTGSCMQECQQSLKPMPLVRLHT